jgi:hypothetical protein
MNPPLKLWQKVLAFPFALIGGCVMCLVVLLFSPFIVCGWAEEMGREEPKP